MTRQDTHMDPLFYYALRLGDDALVLGQRLGEWCGHAPTIEVDLSLANLGLDLIGQAMHFLGLAGDIEGAGRDADKLAFFRDELDFTNCLLVEQPNGDFAQTMTRQWLYSTYQALLFDALKASSDARFAEVADKASKEVRYHADLAADWVVRLGDGTGESHKRMLDALAWHWRFVPELFAMDSVDKTMMDAGVGVDKAGLRPLFDAQVNAVLDTATLPRQDDQMPLLGGRSGHHSEHLGHLLATMQHIPRSHPDARW
ncbi:MAG: 1,2-phenylacetyl-CoA epoxidase subunit PaaC [Pseudomonadota bacterium]